MQLWEQYAVLHLTRCTGINHFILSITPKNDFCITTRSFVSWHNCRLGIISRRLSTISLDQTWTCITKHIYQYYFGTTVYVRLRAITQPPYRNYCIYNIRRKAGSFGRYQYSSDILITFTLTQDVCKIVEHSWWRLVLFRLCILSWFSVQRKCELFPNVWLSSVFI